MQLSKNPRTRLVWAYVHAVTPVFSLVKSNAAGTDMAEQYAGISGAGMRCRGGASAEVELLADVLLLEHGVRDAVHGILRDLGGRRKAGISRWPLHGVAATAAHLLVGHRGHGVVPPQLEVRPGQPGQRPPLQGLEEGLVDLQDISPGTVQGQLQKHDEDPRHVVIRGAIARGRHITVDFLNEAKSKSEMVQLMMFQFAA